MTVVSLWKVLDAAGCGVAVGIQDFIDSTPAHARNEDVTNPWNYNPIKSSLLADQTTRSSS
jgi:hypothetical protein